MPSLFWTGKLSPMMKLTSDLSNALAWVTGNARDTAAMKRRIKMGYDGAVTDNVTRYDEFGLDHYTRISKELLEGTEVQEKVLLDVGCGTGILSLLALEQGAAKVMCCDMSEYMLGRCKEKAKALHYPFGRIDFRQVDAESLPFESDSFDAVISGMVLGLIPNQEDAITEMVRVLKPGGTLSISTHGPELCHEACEATLKALPKIRVFGYRVEFWPRDERDIARMFSMSGLLDVSTRRLTWKEDFADGNKAYDFFASTSSAWWYSRFPPEKIAPISQKVRCAFERTPIRKMTADVILAHGRKP